MTIDSTLMQELMSLVDENALAKIQMILLLLSLVLALMQCYFGYRFLKFWIGVLGFFLGTAVGFAVSLRFFEVRTWYPWAIGLTAGALLSLLAYKLYLAGVFVFSGFTAASAVYAVTELPAVNSFLANLKGETLHNIIVIAVCLIAFIVVGILSVKYAKPFIIIVTSLSGALLASRTLVRLIPSMEEKPVWQLAAAAALGASGVLLQHLMNLGKK
ncbi:MAG: TMEM198/TM7SF3 family protein [Lachnospiraceae bacterium]|nr:TMEM198/TM7SF3 family protein [Lachnospiraceae bacterium]